MSDEGSQRRIIICIYHGNCADGFTAAWAVRKALGASVEFIAGVYQNAPPDVRGKDVILVDFSYKRSVIDEMAKTARTILILDHHKSAMEDLAGLPLPVTPGPTDPAPADWGFHDVTSGYDPNSLYECARENNNLAVYAVFDGERSGAGIAWDFFHHGKPRPTLVNYVEDRDLWRFKLPRSRGVNACIFSFPYEFKTWDWLASRAEETVMGLQGMADEGDAIERKHHKDIAELVKVMQRRLRIGGHIVPAASLPYTLTSDAGHLMAQGEPFAACYWDTLEGRVFSLRSTDAGLDVSKIAAIYGGGGHHHAAGFRVPISRIAEFEVSE